MSAAQGRPKQARTAAREGGGHASSSNLSASILARLLALAKQRGDDYSLLLNRFGMERLLARVSVSAHADRFLLKGALLFALWYDTPHRPTRDADLLGFGPDDEANLIATFREVAAMDLGDGIVFDPDSVKADAIREDNTYGGTRIKLVARIGSARCALQIDVGFGDAVTPGPQTVAYPTLLGDFPAPTLRGLSGVHRDCREVPGHGDAGASEQPHEGLLRPRGDRTAHGARNWMVPRWPQPSPPPSCGGGLRCPPSSPWL